LLFCSFFSKIKKIMNVRKEDNNGSFIRFSIGTKLVIIIIILVLASLGAITFFSYYMVSHDAETAAEKSNFDFNRRASAETERILENIRSNALVLIQVINSAGVNSETTKQARRVYFEENKQIAALIFQASNNNVNTLINEEFFFIRGVDPSPVLPFFTEAKPYFQRAAAKGEHALLNAYDKFSMHLLALFLPITTDPKAEGRAALILFSPTFFNNSLSYGVNESFLINNYGDVLIHPNFELVKTSANISNMEYIAKIRENVMQSRQDLREIDGVKHYISFTKLKIGASIVITNIEYNKIFDEIRAVTIKNLIISAVIVFIALFSIRYFSKNLSADLLILSAAVRKLEDGDFNVDLEPKARDEMGLLTYNFKRMSEALGIFGKFSNREIAIKAMHGEIKPGGMQKQASVFFCGIRGFTEKYKKFYNEFGRDASDKFISWLNEYLTQISGCVEKTNGALDKFIGDTVMAHWGTAYTTGSPAKDAFNCVKAALILRKAFVVLNREREQSSPVNISCGICSGFVTAGQLGTAARAEYTVIGEPVNIAAKIQALNKSLGTDILISESTWNLVKFFFSTEEMPPLTIKGREKPMRIFAVVNHVSVTNGPKTLAELRRLLGIRPPA